MFLSAFSSCSIAQAQVEVGLPFPPKGCLADPRSFDEWTRSKQAN